LFIGIQALLAKILGYKHRKSDINHCQAITKYIQSDKGGMVEMYLKKFFDRVDRGILILRLARIIKGERLLKLDCMSTGVIQAGGF
jgi:hypothetical protein